MYGNYEAIFISVLMNCMQSLRQSWYFASVITCLGCNAYHWDVHGLSSCDTNMAIHYKVILMFECVSIENEKSRHCRNNKFQDLISDRGSA